MPDLNLKGEEEQQAPAQEPSGHRRGRVLIGILAGTLVVAVAGFAVFKLGLPHPQERELTQPETQSTLKSDTLSQRAGVVDTLVKDSIGTRAPLVSTVAAPESSSVALVDTSFQKRGSGEFTIQLSAWASGKGAAKELRRLRRCGLDVYLSESGPDSLGRVWNRIRMGHYQTLDEAKKVADRFLDTLVVGYTFEKEN
ncbi:MAG: SPOR domain-containing protein [Bacteroidota bacterium]